MAESGLAIATSIAAGVQVVLLAVSFSRRASPLAWPALRTTLARSAAAAALMSLAVLMLGYYFPIGEKTARLEQAVHLSLSILLGIATYLAIAWLLDMHELRILLLPPTEHTETTPDSH